MTVLVAAQTPCFAQLEFDGFTNALNRNAVEEFDPAALGPAGSLPVDGGMGGFGVGTPQTPEELQALMNREYFEALYKGARALPLEVEDPFKEMTNVESKITAVTVFSDRATVTRTAEVAIVKGAQTLVLKDIPSNILPESLRAEGSSSDAEITLGAILKKVVSVPLKVADEDRVSLEDMDKLRAEAKKVRAEKKSYLAQKDFLENLSRRAFETKGEGTARIELKPEEWVKASRAYRDGMAEVQGVLAGLDAREAQISVDIARKEHALRRAYDSKNKMEVVVLPIVSDAKGKMELKVSYQMSNVGWQPHYDARFSTKSSALEIVQFATVRQGTVENWKDVELTLSTAQPQRKSNLREIKPLWIDALEPRPANVVYESAMKQHGADPLHEWRQKAEARRLSLENEAPPPEDELMAPDIVPIVQPILPVPRFGKPVPVRIASARIESGGFVVEYKIPGLTTVTPDGSETKLLLGSFNAESKPRVYIHPQQGTEAHLMIHTKLKGENPILPGKVNVFRDGAFSGVVTFPLLQPGGEYDLSFGIDDQVIVKRRTLRDEKQEEGLFSKDNQIVREYVTELQNLHATDIEVYIKEATPVPKNEKITVDLRPQFTTKGYKKDDDNIKGLLSWQFDMHPKEKREVKLGWMVNWPKDHKLQGLQ